MSGVADTHAAECLMELVERCKQGDARAQREFVEARSGQVYRWAVLLGLRPSEAEDAVQEVLWTALRRIATCRSPEAITCWLYQITRRIAANQRRRAWWKRVWLTSEEPEQAFLPSQALGVDQELDLRRCLSRLSPKLSEVLVLMDIEGFTREEVAAMLKLPTGTVASRLRLAREAFRASWTASRQAPADLARRAAATPAEPVGDESSSWREP
jgi:RNA polymerase sigma-70 factor, ECF subfamily